MSSTELIAVEVTHNQYKHAFVNFIEQLAWDWFVTIGVGSCPPDEEVLRRLRLIEAHFCKKYLLNRYHKLPDQDRFSMAAAFEGEQRLNTRHAHLLVHVPKPMKRGPSRRMLIAHFPWEFMFLWHALRPAGDLSPPPWQASRPDASHSALVEPIMFGRANSARKNYTVKDVQMTDVPWSRFEFITPPKTKKFKNENLSVIYNRDRQKRTLCAHRHDAFT
jgi:hypothetical protein